MKRDNSGTRHPGHIIQISGLEKFKSRVYYKDFKFDIDDSINMDYVFKGENSARDCDWYYTSNNIYRIFRNM
jgi:hypothetical protein